MGRYYDGDIEGKWWFGVQSSTTPERFGADATFVDYRICNDDDFKDEMKELKKGLGDKRKTLDEFFKKNNGYNDAMLMEFFKAKYPNYTKENLTTDLSDYADYQFGLDVAEYFKETGENYCNLSSEL
jgi:hypothetical protein